MEIGGIRHGGITFRKLKDDNNYILGNKGDNFRGWIQNKSGNEKRNGQHNAKVVISKCI